MLIFVRAHCKKDFPLYIETLKSVVPFFFAVGHTHYACWLPIHIRDLENLPSLLSRNFKAMVIG